MEEKSNTSEYMQEALYLAQLGSPSPNPYVGAIIIKDNKILGKGFHKKAGQPHAEIQAIQNAKEQNHNIEGATMFVTLEPCCHQGKTPPCTKAIIKEKIKKVIIATTDPNPLVQNKGTEELKKAGIVVETGLLEKEAQKLNEIFFHFIKTKTPFVIQKVAMSLDGKIACNSGESKWITGEESRRVVHEIRNKVDAILVGKNTVIKDNPKLTCRLQKSKKENTEKNKEDTTKDPLRIVLDTNLETSTDANVYNDNKVIVICKKDIKKEKKIPFEKKQIEILELSKEKINVKELLTELGKKEITSILVEGGSEVHGSFIDNNAVNKVFYFIAPKIIGGTNAKSPIGGEGINSMEKIKQLKGTEITTIGNDILIEGYLK